MFCISSMKQQGPKINDFDKLKGAPKQNTAKDLPKQQPVSCEPKTLKGSNGIEILEEKKALKGSDGIVILEDKKTFKGSNGIEILEPIKHKKVVLIHQDIQAETKLTPEKQIPSKSKFFMI